MRRLCHARLHKIDLLQPIRSRVSHNITPQVSLPICSIHSLTHTHQSAVTTPVNSDPSHFTSPFTYLTHRHKHKAHTRHTGRPPRKPRKRMSFTEWVSDEEREARLSRALALGGPDSEVTVIRPVRFAYAVRQRQVKLFSTTQYVWPLGIPTSRCSQLTHLTHLEHL
eukprot:GHVN01086688.1.p1 GENE.GHVN01086688.1~~GHVN01086688.1.p1  ORF type:complete len:167 (-),score=35.83 GHVN01086688.1:15-515(-)